MRQEGQRGNKCDKHGKTGKETEIDSWQEIREYQDGKADDNDHGGVVHGMSDRVMAAVKRTVIIAVYLDFFFKTMDIMDSVIDCDTNADGCNSDRHHIQRDIQPSHHTQYGTG